MYSEAQRYKNIDHIAVAVPNLEDAVAFFVDVLGFRLVRRLETRGRRTGMISAVMEYNQLKFVLCQGTEPDSSMSKLVDAHGAGVAHIAIAVDDVQSAVDELSERGLHFITSVIGGPNLQQVFTSRNSATGISWEFLKRGSEEGFVDENVQDLFDQLEKSESH
jgi:methylmalonyl-CoA epimerase